MSAPTGYERWISRAVALGATGAKVISPTDVVTAAWVRMKCQYGCSAYGTRLTCPPYSPTHDQTRAMLDDYETALLIHMGQDPNTMGLVAQLERELFLAGCYKAFGFGSGPCRFCRPCDVHAPCKHPDKARPAMEASGIDVFSTTRRHGFPLQVVDSDADPQNYYGIVLIG